MNRGTARRARMYKAIVGLAALSVAATACSSSKSTPKATATSSGKSSQTKTDTPNTFNAAKVKDGGKIIAVLEKKVKFWNILDAEGSNFETVQIMNALSPAAYIVNPDLSTTLNADLLTDASLQAGAANQTIVYHIKPNAVWNDGTPISAKDFVYAWLSENGSDTNITAASTSGYSDIASVTGSDNDKTVTVVWKAGKSFPDWKSLFSSLYPANLAAAAGYKAETKTDDKGNIHSVDEPGLEASWKIWGDTPKWSGGPYIITSHADDGTETVVGKNPKWYGSEIHLDEIKFKTISDATQEPTALCNGEVDQIQPQPQVNLLKSLDACKTTVSTQVGAGVVFEHFDLNMQNSFFGGTDPAAQKDPAKLALRKALLTAVDRDHLVKSTVGLFDPASKPLNSRMLVPTQEGYADNVTKYGLGSGKIDDAKKLLTDAGYKGVGTKLQTPDGKDVPAFRMRYTVGNKVREDECNQFASAAAKLGVTVTVESTDDLNATLNNADSQHAFDIVVFAWVGTPFPFSANAPLYVTNPAGTKTPAGGNYGWYSNADADKALNDATSNLDSKAAIADLNKADDLISQDAYTLPLYQKDTLVAYKNTLGNIRDNPTSVGPTYNIQQWGFKATTS